MKTPNTPCISLQNGACCYFTLTSKPETWIFWGIYSGSSRCRKVWGTFMCLFSTPPNCTSPSKPIFQSQTPLITWQSLWQSTPSPPTKCSPPSPTPSSSNAASPTWLTYTTTTWSTRWRSCCSQTTSTYCCYYSPFLSPKSSCRSSPSKTKSSSGNKSPTKVASP